MRTGRPRLSTGKAKAIQVCVRLTPEEHRLVKKLASSMNVNRPEVLRQALGYIAFLSRLESPAKPFMPSEACRSDSELQSIRKMEQDGYRLLERDELKKAVHRMEESGFMERRRLPNTPEGRRTAKQLAGTYFNVFKRI